MAMDHDRIRFLERLGANAWPARETAHIDGWQLGFNDGVTRRADSVLPLRWDSTLDPGRVIAAAERLYRTRDLVPCFKLTEAALPAGLDALLTARGYRREGDSEVLVAPTASVTSAMAVPEEVARLDQPAEDWATVCWPSPPVDPLEARRRTALAGRIRRPRMFALAACDGAPAGAALGAFEDGWAGITAVHTLPAFRRRGVARRLLAALAHWAKAQGAANLYLQVEADNHAASVLYRSAGFARAYDYHYRVLAG